MNSTPARVRSRRAWRRARPSRPNSASTVSFSRPQLGPRATSLKRVTRNQTVHRAAGGCRTSLGQLQPVRNTHEQCERLAAAGNRCRDDMLHLRKRHTPFPWEQVMKPDARGACTPPPCRPHQTHPAHGLTSPRPSTMYQAVQRKNTISRDASAAASSPPTTTSATASAMRRSHTAAPASPTA